MIFKRPAGSKEEQMEELGGQVSMIVQKLVRHATPDRIRAWKAKKSTCGLIGRSVVNEKVLCASVRSLWIDVPGLAC